MPCKILRKNSDLCSVRIPPLRHKNPKCPLWVLRIFAIRNARGFDSQALERPWVREPNVSTVCCPAKPEERRTNQSKRAMRPLQGSSARRLRLRREAESRHFDSTNPVGSTPTGFCFCLCTATVPQRDLLTNEKTGNELSYSWVLLEKMSLLCVELSEFVRVL